MGSGASSNDNIRREWMEVFRAMQFTKQEVHQFYEVFNSVDADHSGSIDVVELLKFLDIESSIFTERIFAAFDKDGTGKIDFFEFVVSLWKFCALGKESINVFAFDLYDTDADGALTEVEVRIMFFDLYWYGSQPKEDDASRAALAELLDTGTAYITIEEFRPFCAKHHTLLAPVFAVQDKLRVAAMGTAFWESMSKRKIELSKGHHVELENLMVHASDREQFNHILNDRSHHGVGHMVRQMMDNMETMMHMSSPSEDDGEIAPSTSAKSIGRLFNPFRSKAPAPEQAEAEGHHHHKRHHGDSSEHNSGRSQGSHNSHNNNKLKSRSIERHPSDGNATVPTIELGSNSENYDANTLATLGQ